MKKLRYLIVAVVLLTACNNTTNEENQNSTTLEQNTTAAPTSAYSALGKYGQALLDALIIAVDKYGFYDPSNVRILNIGDNTDNYVSPTVSYLVEIQGHNKVGGVLDKWYVLMVDPRSDREPPELSAYRKGSSWDWSEIQNRANEYKKKGFMAEYMLCNVNGSKGDIVEYNGYNCYYNYDWKGGKVDYINIAALNRAYAEYWANKGL